MPIETPQAIEWALTQQYMDYGTGETFPVTVETLQPLVDKVREYFNVHEIQYDTFSYDDLVPYLIDA
ncbi:hypothetical protein HGI30_15305 [Paenibacillus albicereus]|uniref:Uncharacterized protein n=1 Tax=Paenibacillus albicereus TaxID=2726185 RepID=A0A6H2GZM8_9BACL|nr:hypothetical protein [Paenibacillus albicereus]QJC52799.1 hypothetical protein HGI30_15305 [Paenibacillus albicereus]